MKSLRILFLAATSVAAFTSTVSAFASIPAPQGWYLEGNLGTSRVQNKNYGINTYTSNPGVAFGFDLGYKFISYFGLEAGYTHYVNTLVKSAGVQVAKDSHYSFDLAAKGMLPISDSGFEIFAKFGLARANSHTTITNNAAAAGLGITTGTRTGAGVYLGVGADYAFTPTLSLNGQWARAKGNTSVGYLDMYSFGLNWIFA